MSEEEKKAIEEQYKEGLVNLSNVIEPLINQFKVDYSLDIQQCRLIINYLLMERDFNEDYYDELDKEIEELKENNKQKYYHLVKSNELEEEINNAWENKINEKIEEYEEIIESSIIKDDYKREVEHIIRVLEELKEE